MPLRNKPVGTHAVDMLLTCGCIQVEPIEAAIFIPSVGDARTCDRHRTVQRIQRVGGAYWLDLEEDQKEDQTQNKKAR